MNWLLVPLLGALAISVAGQSPSKKLLPANSSSSLNSPTTVETEPGKQRFQIALPFSSARHREFAIDSESEYRWEDGDRAIVVHVSEHPAGFFKSTAPAEKLNEAIAYSLGSFLKHQTTWSLVSDVKVGTLDARDYHFGNKETGRLGIARAFMNGPVYYEVIGTSTSQNDVNFIQDVVKSFRPVK
jgi:hypothetical protein